MNKRIKIIASVGILLFVTVCSMMYFQNYKKEQELHNKQTELAKVMEVGNENYPYFPVDYLSKTIKYGMTFNEAHNFLLGYEDVYNDNESSEIYYYFSKDDDKAERIWIMYDKKNQYKVLKISGEDKNSNSFIVEGWSEGLLTLIAVPHSATNQSNWGTPIPDWQGLPVMQVATEGKLVDYSYIYFAKASLEEVENFYKEKMEADGWSLLNYQKNNGGYGGSTIIMDFQRDGEEANIKLVFVAPDNSTMIELTQTK